MELIKVTEQNGEQLVSARELHEKLGIKERFSVWFERIIKTLNLLDSDYRRETYTSLNNQELQDFLISVDIGKHIAMVSGGENASDIRNYFIMVEKAWNSPEKIMARALQIANHQIETYKQQLEYQKPLVEFADKMLMSKDSVLVRVYAKILNDEGLNIGEKKLYSWFRENGYLNKTNEPYQQYMEYFEIKPRTYDTPFGTKTTTTTYIKPKGQLYFFKKIKKYLGVD